MAIDYPRERRRSPRRRQQQRKVLLQADLSLLDATAPPSADDERLTLLGETRNISAEGLAIVVTSIAIDERFITRAERTLNIILDLPEQPVKVEAVPVRFVRLDEQNPHRGYLIGAQITHIHEESYRCFSQYLRQSA